MSEINKTVCDGPDCKNEIDHSDYGAPTYHRLSIGGSDFTMSFGSPEERVLDFCCFECLKKYVDEVCEARQTEVKTIKETATDEMNKLFKEGGLVEPHEIKKNSIFDELKFKKSTEPLNGLKFKKDGLFDSNSTFDSGGRTGGLNVRASD